MVDLPVEYQYKYPSSLSGGQKQRVGIARAMATNPSFVVLDEPTSALDVSVQARIISILKRLQKERNVTYLFISHDLSLIKNVADRIGVMYLGQLVEVGETDTVFSSPKHPYTQALLSAISAVTDEGRRTLPDEMKLEGEIPDPINKPQGCPYRTRCAMEFSPCSETDPEMYEVGNGHTARCFLNDDQFEEGF
jgi:oligopeptide transport system ATP-binding protein